MKACYFKRLIRDVASKVKVQRKNHLARSVACGFDFEIAAKSLALPNKNYSMCQHIAVPSLRASSHQLTTCKSIYVLSSVFNT